MYQNYIFDLYGTLANIRTDEEKPYLWEKMSEIYAAFGAGYKPEELRIAFRKFEKEVLEKLEKEANALRSCGENVEPDLSKVFTMLYEQKGAVCNALQAKMTAVVFRALSREFLYLYDGVAEFLEELQDRGRGVYLLSNAQTDFTRPELEMLGIAHYFDGIFISSEQGVKKPSPVFFRRLTEQFGLKPSECIMIGNDEAADIAGAEAVGMDSLYIHTDISPQEYGRVQATYRVMDGDFRKIKHLILKS